MRTFAWSARLPVLIPPLLVAGTALAQAPAGPEFRVSSGALVQSRAVSIASDAAGNFALAWARYLPPDSDVHVRLFNAQGQPLGPDVEVRAFTGWPSWSTGIAREPGGAFVVVWDELDGAGGRDIFARRHTAAGAPQGAAFRVNTYTTGWQWSAAVAKAPDGTFVVVWANEYEGSPALSRVLAQRFASDGSALGDEFAVDAAGTSNQEHGAVATDAAGNFVVAWGAYDRLDARRFSSGGAPIGPPFQVTSTTPTFADYPSVAVHPDGRFMISWVGFQETMAVLGRRYAADGVPLGGELLVRALNGNAGFSPTTTATVPLPSGGYMVAWTNMGADAGDSAVEAKRFDSDGVPSGRSFLINSTEADFQFWPVLASDPSGRVASAWLSRVPLGVFDVFGQRFGLLDTVALSADPSAGATSDGNGVLEPGETADLRPTWRNNTAAPLAMAGALPLFTGPAGPTYTVDDGSGSYGIVPAGGTQACVDCYRIGVTAPSRPATHWDGTATELIGDGTDGLKRWVVHVGASFDDVPPANGFYRFVETLLHRGVTAGCSAAAYCPADAVTREQMAVFVLAAREERTYAPQFCAFPPFTDVPATSPFCRWIRELARRGVVSGCGSGNYCPADAVTREQMAVFVLRTLDPSLDPPVCTTPVFGDVPASSPFCRWVEELARRGVVTGCGGGNYCPTAPVTREQMAVFLTATFGLTLYGP